MSHTFIALLKSIANWCLVISMSAIAVLAYEMIAGKSSTNSALQIMMTAVFLCNLSVLIRLIAAEHTL